MFAGKRGKAEDKLSKVKVEQKSPKVKVEEESSKVKLGEKSPKVKVEDKPQKVKMEAKSPKVKADCVKVKMVTANHRANHSKSMQPMHGNILKTTSILKNKGIQQQEKKVQIKETLTSKVLITPDDRLKIQKGSRAKYVQYQSPVKSKSGPFQFWGGQQKTAPTLEPQMPLIEPNAPILTAEPTATFRSHLSSVHKKIPELSPKPSVQKLTIDTSTSYNLSAPGNKPIDMTRRDKPPNLSPLMPALSPEVRSLEKSPKSSHRVPQMSQLHQFSKQLIPGSYNPQYTLLPKGDNNNSQIFTNQRQYNVQTSPKGRDMNPSVMDRAYRNEMLRSPSGLQRSPKGNMIVHPSGLQRSPKGNMIVQSPNSMMQSPNSMIQSPNGKLQSPNGKIQSPRGMQQSPNERLRSPNHSVYPINNLQGQLVQPLNLNTKMLSPTRVQSAHQISPKNVDTSRLDATQLKTPVNVTRLPGFANLSEMPNLTPITDVPGTICALQTGKQVAHNVAMSSSPQTSPSKRASLSPKAATRSPSSHPILEHVSTIQQGTPEQRALETFLKLQKFAAPTVQGLPWFELTPHQKQQLLLTQGKSGGAGSPNHKQHHQQQLPKSPPQQRSPRAVQSFPNYTVDQSHQAIISGLNYSLKGRHPSEPTQPHQGRLQSALTQPRQDYNQHARHQSVPTQSSSSPLFTGNLSPRRSLSNQVTATSYVNQPAATNPASPAVYSSAAGHSGQSTTAGGMLDSHLRNMLQQHSSPPHNLPQFGKF